MTGIHTVYLEYYGLPKVVRAGLTPATSAPVAGVFEFKLPDERGELDSNQQHTRFTT